MDTDSTVQPSHEEITSIRGGLAGPGGWSIACFAVLALAAFLRLYALDLKPIHHDEGINGNFLTILLREGIYKYDPVNYHGPTLYYLMIPVVLVFGLSDFAIRFLPSLLGIATVWLVLRLRPYIGDWGTIAAATLLAVSPAAVFYSRYFIHETVFVFFTLGIVVAALRFHQKRSAMSLMLASASAAMMFATKETAFVSMGTLLLAWIIAVLWTRNKAAARQSMAAWVGSEMRVIQLAWGAGALFLLINVVFYSSFFSNWGGLRGALESLMIWTKTGTSEFHAKPFLTYLKWLVQEELPILALAAAGSMAAVFGRPANRFAVFAGAWAFGLFVAYSIIPYKTPWLMLSFIVPMAISAGYALQVVKDRRLSLSLAGLAITVCAYQTIVLNFREYDNDQYPYVYVQTKRDTVALLDEIDRLAERSGTKDIGINIVSPEHWPLPWHFRDNPRSRYSGAVAASYDPNETPIIIGRESDQRTKLLEILGTDYREVGVYALRPGVRLVLFARRDLLE